MRCDDGGILLSVDMHDDADVPRWAGEFIEARTGLPFA